MKLFKHSQGFIVAFGFDMTERRPSSRRICWSDPDGTWEPSLDRLAGYIDLTFTVDPEFVRECDGKIIAYQPGKCVEMILVGQPFVWQVRTLQSDTLQSDMA
jgi:hypothetical protein